MAGIEAVRPFSEAVVESCADQWAAAVRHPFVVAVADGSLDPGRFHVWIQQDRLFVRELGLFVDELLAIAPDDDIEGLRSGRAALEPELGLFEAYARRAGIRLDVNAVPACAEYVGFVRDSPRRGYANAVVAYYGCERAYLEAWLGVRARAGLTGPYAEWIANWTSDAFVAYVGWLGSRVDSQTYDLDEAARAGLTETFVRTVAFEVAFWDACYAPAT